MFPNLNEDLQRKCEGFGHRPEDQTFFRRRVTPLLELGTVAVVVHRFGRWAYGVKIPLLRQVAIGMYLVVNTLCMMITGCHIHRESDIGPGLVVHNFGGVFILADRIGHSCTLNQGVSVVNMRGHGRPTIGNNCYLGAGCTVLGKVRLGDNVVVGANSLVLRDVEDNCTVLGVPARVVARKAKSKYLDFAITESVAAASETTESSSKLELKA